MKQIVDKLNKIALAIDENVEVPTSDLIIDSLDAITTAFGGTPNDSNLIVDKLEDIAGVAHGGSTPTGTINITENGTGIDVAQYRYADVNVSGGGGENSINLLDITIINNNSEEDSAQFNFYYSERNLPVFIDGHALVDIPSIDYGETINVKVPFMNTGTVNYYNTSCDPSYEGETEYTVSDLVNLSYNQSDGDDFARFYTTDPDVLSKTHSATITITHYGGK